MYIRAAVPSNRDRFAKKLSAIKQEVNYAEVKQFVVVSDDPEFCLGTTLLCMDTRNTLEPCSLYFVSSSSHWCWVSLIGVLHRGFLHAARP